jgi:prepilin-type N-terminal cleavage/methylation domain-containing protein
MKRRNGFTLMEVVLAIALTAVVVYLLTTAIELYLFCVDASRTRVESAQLARTILDQIADDLASARLTAQPSTFGGGFNNSMSPDRQGAGVPGGNQSGGNQPGGPQSGGGYTSGGYGGQSGGGSSGGGFGPTTPAAHQSLFGAQQIVRIDRAAAADWQRASRLVDPLETASRANMPTTVRYYFLDAQRLTTERAAREGVRDERTATNISGLYRETIPTASIPPTADPLTPPTAQQQTGATVELLAPEVVGFELAYFDGKQLNDEWDSMRANGLPVGVEIRITIAEPAYQSTPDPEAERRRAEGRYAANELVEYTRFVYLPLIAPGPPAQPLLPAAQQDNGNQRDGQNGGNRGGNNGNTGGGSAAGGNNNAQFQTN